MAGYRPRALVITGAGKGIGRALALCYAEPGVTLGIVGRNADRLDSVAMACRERGATVEVGYLDVRDGSALREWLSAFDAQHPIDLLIANAGIASTLKSRADWEFPPCTAALIETNFFGVLNALQPAVEFMRARRTGQIAVVSSLAALRGMAISPAYCASKAALLAYCDSVRPLLAQDGVSLAVIMPGFVKTAMSDVFPGNKPFMWTAERAARHIRRKLERRSAEIAFPFGLAMGIKLLRTLPSWLADAILGRLSYLPREEQ